MVRLRRAAEPRQRRLRAGGPSHARPPAPSLGLPAQLGAHRGPALQPTPGRGSAGHETVASNGKADVAEQDSWPLRGERSGKPGGTALADRRHQVPPPRLPLSQPPPAGASPCSLPRLRAATVGTCCCHRNHRCYHLPSLMPSPVPSAVEDPQGSTKGSPGHRLRPVVPPTDEHPSPEERGPGRTFSLLSLRVASGAARETRAFWSRCSFGHAF